MKLLLLSMLGILAMAAAHSVQKRQILVDELTLLYLSLPGYIPMTQDIIDECWRCTDWDQEGFGIMNHTDADRCWSYIVCWKDRGVFRVAFEKDCPVGTIYNPVSGPRGIPCTYGSPSDVPGCIPQPPTVWTIEDLACPYHLMDQNNPPADTSSFGIFINGVLTFVDDCGVGGVWDDVGCACVVHTGNCKCMLLMDFEGEIQAHGCNGGWVTSEGTFVDISQPGIQGNGAMFNGFDAIQNNGGHLKCWVLDGVFDNACTKWRGYKQLTVAAWINYQGNYDRTEGIVGYGDCSEGATIYLTLFDGVPCGGLKTQGNPLVEVCATNSVPSNTWVYIAMVYDEPTLELFVIQNLAACTIDPNIPPCQPVDTETQNGCVESRMCGMQVGFTGTTKTVNEFFVGMIDQVQVYNGADLFACPGLP